MKTFKSFIAEGKKATITRKAMYRGRTTADVEYQVHDENGQHIRTTKTKKEAKLWKDMHELPKEEMHKKYPELRPK
jgi:hypothetical protein